MNTDPVLRAAAWLADHTRVVINVWLEYIVPCSFARSSRNIHLTWKISEAGDSGHSLASSPQHLSLLYRQTKDSTVTPEGLVIIHTLSMMSWTDAIEDTQHRA